MTTPDPAPAEPDADAPAPAEGVPGIYVALDQLNQSMRALAKSERNVQQDYKFRGIDQLYNAVHPLLAEARVITVPKDVVELRSEQRTRANGGPTNYVLVRRIYRFLYLGDGTYEDVEGVGEALDTGDKAANKAQSNAHKYAFFQLFTIPTDEPEADHSHEEATGTFRHPDPWDAYTGTGPETGARSNTTLSAGPSQGQGPAFDVHGLTQRLRDTEDPEAVHDMKSELIAAMRARTVENAAGSRSLKEINNRLADLNS